LRDSEFNFQNILVIDFGQLGDVILSLPALKAIRDKFPDSHITLLLGKPGADVVRIADVSDDQILVDRVDLRDGNKIRSIGKILRLVKQIRSRKFDFVIDLHSLSETNILGFISGAKWRLFATRENRSLDRLARFPTRPPNEDKTKHHAERYFDVLQPLGLKQSERRFNFKPLDSDLFEAKQLFAKLGIADKTLVGLFLGAGHPGRRWKVDNFVELSRRLSIDPQIQVLVLLGPEERDLRRGLDEKFGDSAIVIDEMPLLSFFAIVSHLNVFVSGDTGPLHLAAITDANIVLISEVGAPTVFTPLTDNLVVLKQCSVSDLRVEDVENAVLRFGDAK